MFLTLTPVVLMLGITCLAVFVFLYNKKRYRSPDGASGRPWMSLGARR